MPILLNFIRKRAQNSVSQKNRNVFLSIFNSEKKDLLSSTVQDNADFENIPIILNQ